MTGIPSHLTLKPGSQGAEAILSILLPPSPYSRDDLFPEPSFTILSKVALPISLLNLIVLYMVTLYVYLFVCI